MTIYSDDLLELSKEELRSVSGSTSARRRAISSAYYALFHRVCEELRADFSTEASPEAIEVQRRAYRLPDHGAVAKACREISNQRLFSDELQDFARNFLTLKTARADADYEDPQHYQERDAADLLARCERALSVLSDANESERRLFCYYVALSRR